MKPCNEMTVEEAKAAGLGKPKRRTKYAAKKTTVDGITFDSKREASRYSELKLLERGGLISGLVRQVEYRCEVNGRLVCVYRSDFEYTTDQGERVVEDVKGVRTREYRIKAKLLRALHGITIKET